MDEKRVRKERDPEQPRQFRSRRPRTENIILEAALNYAENGLSVIPTDRETKHPLNENGSKGATTDRETIKQWWKWWPSANVAIATGNGLTVIDLDKGHGDGIDDGVENLRDWETNNGHFPDTWTAVTGTGGEHLYFNTRLEIHNVQSGQPDDLKGVDIRGAGGYVIAPPSIHANGNPYYWDIAPQETPIKSSDTLLQKLLADLKPEQGKQIQDTPETIGQGQRNGTLTSLAGKLRKYDGLEESEIEATLQAVNKERCRPPLPEKEVETIAKSVARYESGTLKTKDTPGQAFTAYKANEYLKGGQFDRDIHYFKAYKDRKTGFSNIDEHLTLYPGLAALGGAASLGKTTFAVQMADQLAESGETVLYFSLEQEPIELITKSLARRLYMQDPATPLTNIDIKNGATSDSLDKVRKEYGKTADRFIIVRCNFLTTAEQIKDYIVEFINRTGIRPVVFIDYLQLINPPDDFKGDTRTATDLAIKTFKTMQLEHELFVVLISNFNRAGYDSPVSYSDYKETGMIEYTCDYIWGLQLEIVSHREFYLTPGASRERLTTAQEKDRMVKDAMQRTPKTVEFVSLKSRNGTQSYTCKFDYYTRFDYFKPLQDPADRTIDMDGFKEMTDDLANIFDDLTVIEHDTDNI